MFPIARRNSTINASGPPQPEPVPMVVRSARLREQGGCLVHNIAEFQAAVGDAHPEDMAAARDAWMRNPILAIRLVPGR